MKCSELYVHDGRVRCPARGDLDIERCYVCPHLVGFSTRDELPFVRCRLPSFLRRPGYNRRDWASYGTYPGAL
jgi:hypothetical protein